MAIVTIMHWNIETYGPAKYKNANNQNFINYIAQLVFSYGVDIFCMVEVKNSTSLLVPGKLADAINAIEGVDDDDNPWDYVRVNSGYNNEAYIIMYRVDKDFWPVDLALNTGPDVVPEHGLGMFSQNGQLQFPSRMTARGGRRPFYAMFQTTDMNTQIFSVISYHAMFGAFTPLGVRTLAQLDAITEFSDGTPIDGSLISGDFNTDFNVDRIYYNQILALPSYQATNQMTSLKNNPNNSTNPADFLANAYDNIFQTYNAAAPTGLVVDLLVETANVPANLGPPPAAQANVGALSANAGAYSLAALNHYLARIANQIVAVPPTDMNTSWDFVRETISNHYPVVTQVTI